VTHLARVERVRVGTRNLPKLDAVREAFVPYAPRVRVEGATVSSGVPEQPVGWDEIVTGARNRAHGARASGDCDLAVGIEDGLVELIAAQRREVLNVGCAFVTDGALESLGFSSAFAYPPECVRPALADRLPIGEVFDRVFSAYFRQTSRQTSRRAERGGPPPAEGPSGATTGNIGKLSLGVLPRKDYARQAVLCALVRFLHPALYSGARP
jgi:inosine/xanthosine triphosphatase